MEKVWYKTEFGTEADQTISIYEKGGSLIMEINDESKSKMVYLSEAETRFLARKLMETSKDIFKENISASEDDNLPF